MMSRLQSQVYGVKVIGNGGNDEFGKSSIQQRPLSLFNQRKFDFGVMTFPVCFFKIYKYVEV